MELELVSQAQASGKLPKHFPAFAVALDVARQEGEIKIPKSILRELFRLQPGVSPDKGNRSREYSACYDHAVATGQIKEINQNMVEIVLQSSCTTSPSDLF